MKENRKEQAAYTRHKRSPEEKTFLVEKEIAFTRGWQSVSNKEVIDTYKIRTKVYHMTLLTEAFECGKESALAEKARCRR